MQRVLEIGVGRRIASACLVSHMSRETVPEPARRFGISSCSHRSVQDLILHAPMAFEPDREGATGLEFFEGCRPEPS